MLQPPSPPGSSEPHAAFARDYDVAILGSGVAGAIIARTLGERGLSVLVIEAGAGHDATLAGNEANLERFYTAVEKDNNAPYADPDGAPMPRGADTAKLANGAVNDRGYLVQKGPLELDSTFSRALGGTTRHWEAKALRMLPDDFGMATAFGRGRDWPIGYDDLEAHYRDAERELGVSGDIDDQRYGGLRYPEGYVLPMHRMPPSWLDQCIARDVDGMDVRLDDEDFSLVVRSTPQARNGIPNAQYDGGRGFRPRGAVALPGAELGGRCQGNTNCVPICPVQAKYDARRTLSAALATGNVALLSETVATRVEIDAASGRVAGLHCVSFPGRDATGRVEGTVRARTYVLAANAVETPRLMLASGLPGRAGLMGRNLMDHVYLLTWALMPEIVGAGRGPLCTSGIEDLRTGSYRRRMAAVRFSIHNDGWGWATGAPYTDLELLLEGRNRHGEALRQALLERVARQVLLDCMIEVLPDESNRISVDPAYRDALGNPRPVLSFDVGAYTLQTAAFARGLTRRIYQRLGAEDHTRYDPQAPGFVMHDGEGYVLRGGNHWAGTHVMGASPSTSVVDDRQRSWDHENLYLAGAGSMPSIGTANTTLTLAALSFRTAEAIAAQHAAAASAAARAGVPA